jgi:hypothetical protein
MLKTCVCELPPLILHPLATPAVSMQILEGSRAALMLAGMLPGDGADPEDLTGRVLAARYSEIRMLFYVGKDLLRWIDQCVEVVGHNPELAQAGLRPASFSRLLVENPPAQVRAKLSGWGVAQYASIFSRALGLNAVFREPPEPVLLAGNFLQNFHQYADYLFACWRSREPYPEISGENFPFQIYASEEYSRILQQQWDA